MPRRIHIDPPDMPQHVVQLGNDRQPCFFQDIDRIRYSQDLREIALAEQCGTHAYVLQMNDKENTELVREVLAARGVVKAGFDLRSDQKQLMHRLGTYAQPLLDLDFVFSGRGYPRSIGVKAAIALLFNRRLLKSKRVTTSNWANPTLDTRQILYAANDAYAAWAVLNALDVPMRDLPVWTGDTP